MVSHPSRPRRKLSGAASLVLLSSGAAMLAAGAAAVGFGLASARNFGVRHEKLAVLEPGSRTIRILHVSDLHLVAGDRGKIDFVRGLSALEPDLVINTGDNPGGITAVDDVLAALEPLFDVPGLFVLGSNDFYGPHAANPLRYLRAPTSRHHDDSDAHLNRIDDQRLVAGFTATGQWQGVGNRSLTLGIHDTVLHVAGTHDAHLQADHWPGFDDAADGSVPPVPAVQQPGQPQQPDHPAPLRIGLTHAPYRRVLDAAIGDGCDLLFAGHTHGGQVALPSYGTIVANCDIPTGRAAGLFAWHSAGRTGWVQVSAGIGVSPTMPLRTFCRPEAVVVDLVATDQASA